jgi:hypothetical protein
VDRRVRVRAYMYESASVGLCVCARASGGSLHPSIVRGALHRVSRAAGNVYFEQIRVLKAGVSQRLNIAAWNDGIGPRSDFAGLFTFGPEVMVNRDGRGHSYCGDRGEILGPPQDEQQRRHLPRMFSLIKNES